MKNLLLMTALFTAMTACKKTSNAPLAEDAARIEAAALANGSGLQQVFQDSVYLLTGVAVSENGRMFTNYPKWQGPHRYDLVEILPGNIVQPYPNAAWNSWKEGEDGKNKWVCVQAVYADDANMLWVVDPASPKMGGVYLHSYKLVKINLATNSVEKTYFFDNIADENSYINDVRVDTKNNYAYLTNSNEGGIVVVNLNTGAMRQVLQGNSSVIADPNYTLMIEGKEFTTNYGAPVKINSDGIALSPDGQYLCYKPLSDDRLFKIATKYLQDFSMPLTKLADKVQFVGHFTTTDGMIFDREGNLYLGDLELRRIVKIAPDLTMHVLADNNKLNWPDSYSIAGGYLYISCSQLQNQPKYNTGSREAFPPPNPYTIYRIKL